MRRALPLGLVDPLDPSTKLVDQSKFKLLLRPSGSSESLSELDSELSESSGSSGSLPQIFLDFSSLDEMKDSKGDSLKGSFNTPYFFFDGKQRWVVKLPHYSEGTPGTRRAFAELSSPERAVRVMREIHPELDPKEVKTILPDGKIVSGWMLVYVPGRQSTDAEIAQKITEIFLRTGRVIPDCFCQTNFLTQETREGVKVYCVDVDLALNLSMTRSPSTLPGGEVVCPASPVSKKAWVPGEPFYDAYHQHLHEESGVSRAFRFSLAQCQVFFDLTERYLEIPSSPIKSLNFLELVAQSLEQLHREFSNYHKCCEVYVGKSLKQRAFPLADRIAFEKLQEILNFAETSKNVSDFSLLILQIQELAEKNLEKEAFDRFRRSLGMLKKRLIDLGGEGALREREAEFSAKARAESGRLGAFVFATGELVSELASGVASRASNVFRSVSAIGKASSGPSPRPTAPLPSSSPVPSPAMMGSPEA